MLLKKEIKLERVFFPIDFVCMWFVYWFEVFVLWIGFFWGYKCVLGYVCFLKNGFWKTTFQTFLCLFAIRKVGQRKTLSSQRKIWFGFQESVFLENLDGKYFPEVVKNLKISYYLLIISNLIFKFFIAIYIYILFWIFIF